MNEAYWMGRKVFVTGGTGFLGSHLVEKLVSVGAEVTVLIRDYIPSSNFYLSSSSLKVNSVVGSLENLSLLERALGEYEIETVFHLAAQAIVGVANRNPISTFNANILGTWNVLEACRKSPLIRSVIVASSDKAYGNQDKLPYDESMPLKGIHPYDVSKSCADLISQAYYSTYKLPVCITRCGNLYGGGDLNFNRIVPQTIKAILNNKAPIIRSDGTFIRDYFYVVDAVLAYILLAEKMENLSIHGEAFNFGTEEKYTVLEIVEKVLSIMNSELKPIIMKEGNYEIKEQYLTAAKARNSLDWKPNYSLELGLMETIEWYKKHQSGRPLK